ncbi:hypothetical protein ARMGADRAFT_1079098 [Armillaria gallica]|uniref:Uncharacterized protein n=1 Tax=Armillaria gallica TaxID=47427 RepID=A0A2H3DSI1_ARMGA|nr:hypothetical protein ARMGADRAFT_1079098 [Armillaria gallica]
MKIFIDITTMLKFIKELSDDPMAKTPASRTFLAAVANTIQEAKQVPATHSKKRKQDNSKEGEDIYHPEQLSSLPNRKKSKTDFHNTESKDVTVQPRKISMGGHPLMQKALQVVQNKPKMVRHSQRRGSKGMQDEAISTEEDSGHHIEEAMNLLHEWKWPYMGHKPVWDLNGIPPPLMLLAIRCLAMMTTIIQQDKFTKLCQLITDISKADPGCSSSLEEGKVDTLEGINIVLDVMEGKEAMHDFMQL